MKKTTQILRVIAPAAFLILFLAGCRETVPQKTGILSEKTASGVYIVTVRCLPKEGTSGLQAENTALEAARLSAQMRAKELFPDLNGVKLGEDQSASFDGTAATLVWRLKDPSIKKK